MELVIRRAREADAALMIELLNPIIRAGGYTVMDEPLTLDDQIDFIRFFPERGVFLAAFSASTGSARLARVEAAASHCERSEAISSPGGETASYLAVTEDGRGASTGSAGASTGSARLARVEAAASHCERSEDILSVVKG